MMQRLTRQNILVVDDEAPMRKLLASNLKASGYIVQSAGDGSEGLKLIDEHPFDLLLLGLSEGFLPGADTAAPAAAPQKLRVVGPNVLQRGTGHLIYVEGQYDGKSWKPLGPDQFSVRVTGAAHLADDLAGQPTNPLEVRCDDVDRGSVTVEARAADKTATATFAVGATERGLGVGLGRGLEGVVDDHAPDPVPGSGAAEMERAGRAGEREPMHLLDHGDEPHRGLREVRGSLRRAELDLDGGHGRCGPVCSGKGRSPRGRRSDGSPGAGRPSGMSSGT